MRPTLFYQKSYGHSFHTKRIATDLGCVFVGKDVGSQICTRFKTHKSNRLFFKVCSTDI